MEFSAVADRHFPRWAWTPTDVRTFRQSQPIVGASHWPALSRRLGLSGSMMRSSDIKFAESCSGCPNDERSRPVQQVLDTTPLAHEDLELRPNRLCLVSREHDHPCPVLDDRLTFCDPTADQSIPGDYQVSGICHKRNPVLVGDIGARDQTRRAFPSVNDRTAVPWVRAVSPQARDQSAQAEDVSIEVEADDRWLHAARVVLRRDNSYERAQPTSSISRPNCAATSSSSSPPSMCSKIAEVLIPLIAG